MMECDEEDRTFVVESAIKNKIGNRDEIQLYNQLSLSLELMNDNNFNVIDSSIGDGINFGITTKFPHGLPEKVGLLFFNVNHEFDVSIKETSKCVYSGERYFFINIKKINFCNKKFHLSYS
jgi:hypothetical protein